MYKKGLTISMIFKAQSLNYGEGIGNISELKKLNRGNGDVNTFASRQALRYDIVRMGNEMFNWDLDVVDKSQGTVQFKDDCDIKKSIEMDLFGYMKTTKGNNSSTRSAVCKLSNALSLEPFKSDIELLTNKSFADRINEYPNLANIEQHFSYYTYTITIDLDKIGKDENIEISNEEKSNRIIQLLEIIKMLNRNIRGRSENLSPVFAIGGIYKMNNSFFLGRIKLNCKNSKFAVDTDMLNEVASLKIDSLPINVDTNVGIIDNEFINTDEIKNMNVNKISSIQDFFEDLENNIKEIYK